MTTTTVRKGTNRKAAEAKREKHAQRDVSAKATVADNLDSLGLPELRQLATAKGFSTATKESKAALVRILRANPNGAPAIAAQVAAEAEPKTDAKTAKDAKTNGSKANRAKAKPIESESKVDPKRCEEIGERVLSLRKEYTRGVLADAAGVTASIIWRWENSRPKVDELPTIEALLARCDSGEVAKPEKRSFGGTRVQSKAKTCLAEVESLLSAVPVTGKATVSDLRQAISAALDLIDRNTK